MVVVRPPFAYGFWAGRERSSAYFGLSLFLTGSIVGVFTAQDLLLFYVFFETMLIPLYVLIGVWGGPGRLGATIKFVIYTVAGSLLMLVAIIALGLSQGTFDLTAIGTSSNEVDLLRLRRWRSRSRRRFSRCTGGSPTRTASRRPRWPRVLSGRGLEGGRVRLSPHRDLRSSRRWWQDCQWLLLDAGGRGRCSTARSSRSARPTCAA